MNHNEFFKSIMRPYSKSHFLSRIGKCSCRILDVGCGNNSASYVKKWCPNCYYIGLDVGDYNLDKEDKRSMDEYWVVSPKEFAYKIVDFKNSIDFVICAHNLEHCNEPDEVISNMILSLREGGEIFLSFPSEESVDFPSRGGL